MAASLGHWDIVHFLAEQGASLSSDDKSGFNAFHETVTSGDPNLVTEMMYRRDLQRFTSRVDSIPQLLQRIKDVSVNLNDDQILLLVDCYHLDQRFLR